MSIKIPDYLSKKLHRSDLFSSIVATGLCVCLTVGYTERAFAQTTLQQESAAVDTVKLPVLYGRQKKSNIVQSTGHLHGRRLDKMPVAMLPNALAGQIAGLLITQNSGQPGQDLAEMNLRGKAPLVIVDGIPRDITAVNPEQIESVTVLKDALSTAMLGMRGMDGAILITTRDRADAPGSNVSFTTQSGFQSPVKLRSMLSSYDYAALYNEALRNDSRPEIYSVDDLEAYRTGSDPLQYPNVDWYNTLLRDNARFSRQTLNASGTSSAVNYFVTLDYLDQQGLLKESSENTYQTNGSYKRYLFRSNVGVQIDKRLRAQLNIMGSIQNGSEPGATMATVFADMLNTPNNAYPVLNPDGSLSGNQSYQNNLWGQSTGTGYRLNNNRVGFADLSLRRELDDLAKGLYAKGTVSYNTTLIQEIDRSKNFEVFQPLINVITQDTTYQQFGTRTEQVNTAGVSLRHQQFYTEFALGYDRDWGQHSVQALALYNYDGYQTNNDLDLYYQGGSGRVAYSFNNRYMVEVAGAYHYNNRYTPGRRTGFFPAVGLGWNVHKETFFAENIRFVDQFKLRASVGMVGNALNPGNFVYQQNWTGRPGYVFGAPPAQTTGTSEGNLANPFRTWEKARKINAGFDAAFAHQRGWLSMDYYQHREYDLLQQRGRNTALLGSTYPAENIGINHYFGIELNTGWADRVGQVNYFVNVNFATRDSRRVFMDEIEQEYPWMYQTGRRVGMIRGYLADGFFDTTLQGAAVQGYTPVPGDIRYVDLNEDGVINQLDQTVIGNDAPFLIYGATLGFRYAGFDFSALLQGVSNRDMLLNGDAEWEFRNNGLGQAQQHHLGRWTTATAETATYPRLTVGGNVNNHVVSSFWLHPRDYVRLKNVELGYTFDQQVLQRLHIKSVRLFVNGLNLLATSKAKVDRVDPETSGAIYPLQRVINGGLTIQF